MDHMQQTSYFKTILSLIQKDENIDSSFEESHIHRALDRDEWIFDGFQEVVQQHSSEINDLDRFGQTPLIRVLEHENCSDDIVRLLIANGADVNLPARCGRDPLLCGLANSRSPSVIKALLDENANTNKIYCTRSSLCIAMECCSIGVIELVLQTCHPYKCEMHLSGVHCALTYMKINRLASCTEILNLLFEFGTDLNYFTEDKQYSLCYALRGEFVKECHIQQLLEAGAKVDNCNLHSSSLFCAFVAEKTITANLVQLLLDAGASASIKSPNDTIPLQFVLARREYETEAIRLLLDCPYMEDDVVNEYELLHSALNNESCQNSVIELLIERGGRLDKLDWRDEMPLHKAVRFCPLSVNTFLMEKGSPLNVQNLEGKTPIHMALESMYDVDLVKLLFLAGAHVTPNLLKIAFESYSLMEDEMTLNCFKMIVKIFYLVYSDISIGGWIRQQGGREALVSFSRRCENQVRNVDERYGPGLRKYISGYWYAGDFQKEDTLYDLTLLLRTYPDVQLSMFYDIVSARVGRKAMILKLQDAIVSTRNVTLNYECICKIAGFLSNDDDVFSFLLAFFNPSKEH